MEIRMRVWPVVKEWRIFERVQRRDLGVLRCLSFGLVAGERVNVAMRGARVGWRRESRRERRWADSVERVNIRALE